MQHRDERRGLGGIFFDDLNDYDQEMLLSFATGNCSVIFEHFGFAFRVKQSISAQFPPNNIL